MDRKEFIKKSLLGTAVLATTAASAQLVKNDIDELRALDVVGFNHLPNSSSEHMSNSIIHRAATRGHANHGWLDSWHTFSFANYYNPERMHFGVLRVLNDDTVAAARGFGTHPHDNMEIISVALKGDLEHKDSMGNLQVIREGDVQVMSAGSGITHSEYNRNKDQAVSFLQIWMFPNKKNVTPRYDQQSFPTEGRRDRLQQVLSPSPDDEGVWVHQDAWFYLGNLSEGFSTDYAVRRKGNGVYVFVLSGEVSVSGQQLQARDGFGIWDTEGFSIQADTAAEVLVMDVPMQV